MLQHYGPWNLRHAGLADCSPDSRARASLVLCPPLGHRCLSSDQSVLQTDPLVCHRSACVHVTQIPKVLSNSTLRVHSPPARGLLCIFRQGCSRAETIHAGEPDHALFNPFQHSEELSHYGIDCRIDGCWRSTFVRHPGAFGLDIAGNGGARPAIGYQQCFWRRIEYGDRA